jgi:DNA-directed RNA polymerase specialized sigma24 family protein
MDLDQLLERFMTSVRASQLPQESLVKVFSNVRQAITMLLGLNMTLMDLERIFEHDFIDAIRSRDRSPESLVRLHGSLIDQFDPLIEVDVPQNSGEIAISDEDGYQTAEEDDDNGRYDNLQN